MQHEISYKICKFRENCARNVPLQGVYIVKFNKISVKFSVFWGSYTPIVAPMGVKFGTEEWTEAIPNFIPNSATCLSCGVKNLKIAL